MPPRSPYAARTSVSVEKTQMEIRKLVTKHGATGFAYMEEMDTSAKIAFRMNDRNLLFRVEIPDSDQEKRSRWRALLLVIKAKLEAQATGIETFEEAFLANIVMPGGATVGDTALPRIAQAYESGQDVPLLPGS